jgi:uncharacterized protein
VVRSNLAVSAVVIPGRAVIGGERGFEAARQHWPVSLTMVFGSLAGGGTGEGGGAVAFPAFAKILHMPANQSRIFTLAIQGIGLGGASLSILYLRLPIERRILLYAAPAGIAGVLYSSNEPAPHLSLPEIRIYFTALLISLALALIVRHFRRVNDRNLSIPRFGPGEAPPPAATGFLGAVAGGPAGVGGNIAAAGAPSGAH